VRKHSQMEKCHRDIQVTPHFGGKFFILTA
jgi:hypothetical protein